MVSHFPVLSRKCWQPGCRSQLHSDGKGQGKSSNELNAINRNDCCRYVTDETEGASGTFRTLELSPKYQVGEYTGMKLVTLRGSA